MGTRIIQITNPEMHAMDLNIIAPPEAGRNSDSSDDDKPVVMMVVMVTVPVMPPVMSMEIARAGHRCRCGYKKNEDERQQQNGGDLFHRVEDFYACLMQCQSHRRNPVIWVTPKLVQSSVSSSLASSLRSM